MAMGRTKSGAPSAAERRQTGGGNGLKKGSFPVFDVKSAESALELRGHSSDKEAVDKKVERFANRMHNVTLLHEAEADAKKDAK